MKNMRRRITALVLAMLLAAMPVTQVYAEESAEAELPTATVAPPETEAPAETEVPEETDAPEETEAPEGTEAPEETEAPAETEASTETEVPIETEAPPETELPLENAAAEAVVAEAGPVLTVGEARMLPVGTEGVQVQGTVVFADGNLVILQDETGAIRLSFAEPPELVPGDVLLLTGCRSGGLAVERFEITGTGSLPAVACALGERMCDVRIVIRDAVLGSGSLSQLGDSCALKGTWEGSLKPGDRVDVWGVMIDGILWADTVAPSEAASVAEEAALLEDWNLYFGLLHAHTEVSGAVGTVEEAFGYASGVENLDFFAVTDHSNCFDNALLGAIDQDGSTVSAAWAEGVLAAEAVTDETFVGIFGYEMTWQEDRAIGHMNTFATPGWQTRDQEGFDTLEGYLEALTQVPGSISQFNHPGLAWGDFADFSHRTPQYDDRVHLLEVGGEGGFTAYEFYTRALDQGWHLAPGNSQNNHNGFWGDESQARTVVLAKELTRESIFDAIRSYRAYATADSDLKILYRLNGAVMGSVIPASETLTAHITLEDGSADSIGLVEVITDGGETAASAWVDDSCGELTLELPAGGSYYYLRLTRDTGIAAVTAPVWVDDYADVGIESFAADNLQPDQGASSELTLTVYNNENAEFVLEKVEFFQGETLLSTITDPGTAGPLGKCAVKTSHSAQEPGAVTVRAVVTGTIAGIPREYTAELTLQYQPLEALLLPIDQVRAGTVGEAYCVSGYVTAGTSNPYNTFPGSIYLQDETGGIQILDFTDPGLQLGTPLEVEGILCSRGGNLVLAMTDYALVDREFYRYAPKTMTHETAMDYALHGGELLQIEGSVVSVTKTEDQKGVSRFTLRDIRGDLATVVVEDHIVSGIYGTNTLASEVKLKRTVRAMGLLHVDEYGKTVLRVRNCDEVVYVPPRKDPTNPKTGDLLALLFRG